MNNDLRLIIESITQKTRNTNYPRNSMNKLCDELISLNKGCDEDEYVVNCNFCILGYKNLIKYPDQIIKVWRQL